MKITPTLNIFRVFHVFGIFTRFWEYNSKKEQKCRKLFLVAELIKNLDSNKKEQKYRKNNFSDKIDQKSCFR